MAPTDHGWLTTAKAAARLRHSELGLRRCLARRAHDPSDGIPARETDASEIDGAGDNGDDNDGEG